MWSASDYDNRGFADWERSEEFAEYMLQATEPGGDWDYLDGDKAAEAITDYDWKALVGDMGRFMALHDKGEYRQAADIIADIVTRYCNRGAREDYSHPDID